MRRKVRKIPRSLKIPDFLDEEVVALSKTTGNSIQITYEEVIEAGLKRIALSEQRKERAKRKLSKG